MKAFKPKIVLFLFAVTVIAGCSSDGGDGKDDKGENKTGVAPASGATLIKTCASSIAIKLRGQCYQQILTAQPSVANELSGRNPFLLETWDSLTLEQVSFSADVLSCRNLFPNRCD
jgi:hypothetical protein